MRTILLHDTRTGGLVPLDPRPGRPIGIYACGPTVYARVHVGNGRPFVVFSLLKRFLEHLGHEVVLVANVTDVNDKIYEAAVEQGVPSERLAREMTAAYVADTDGLGIGRPDHEPLASETIGPIVDLIGALVERGHAYAVDGDVYFRVRSLPSYGELSGRDLDQLDQGEGVEGAERKEDPGDFALWKATKPGEDTAWDSPWGRGRPGWHIECSAMAEELLGLEFDIHGGGIDLVFPHHENEAAQTLAGRGRPLARIWMHNGMLRLDDDKMSKSLGNIRGLGAAVAEAGRDALLMYFLGGHYRQPIEYGPERLAEAAARVRRVREIARRLVGGPSPPELARHREEFLDALSLDFNTPRALAAVFEWIREANARAEPAGDEDLRAMLRVLALENLIDDADAPVPPEAVALAERRAAARAARDWAQADRLREELVALGWDVRDGAAGPELVPRDR